LVVCVTFALRWGQGPIACTKLSQYLQSLTTVAVDLAPFAKGSYTALVQLGQRTMAAQVLRTW